MTFKTKLNSKISEIIRALYILKQYYTFNIFCSISLLSFFFLWIFIIYIFDKTHWTLRINIKWKLYFKITKDHLKDANFFFVIFWWISFECIFYTLLFFYFGIRFILFFLLFWVVLFILLLFSQPAKKTRKFFLNLLKFHI